VSLPDGVERHEFDDRESLATRSPTPSSAQTDDGWRRWDPHRSKLAAMLEVEMDTGLDGGETVLYLGAANGTTVSHVARFAGPTYAVEFAPRPMRDLLSVAANREQLIPLLKDARKPESYAHVVEADLDVVVQDVATRGQARVATQNRQFLHDDGRLLASVKARSEDVTRPPEAVFEDVLDALESDYEILETKRLEPYHDDHLAVVATPRTS